MATEYALNTADSMADGESDFETDGLEMALDDLCKRHCCNESFPKSKSYCAEFCQVSRALFGRSVRQGFIVSAPDPLGNVSLQISFIYAVTCVS